MNTLATVFLEKHAQLVCGGLEATFNDCTFTYQLCGITWQIRVTSQHKVSARLLSDMQQWAQGYLAALRAHCSL